jgi:hypothetical protein
MSPEGIKEEINYIQKLLNFYSCYYLQPAAECSLYTTLII